MSLTSTFVLLFLIATIVSLVARRLRIPYTVALVVAGLALGATHVFVAPVLTRDAMFGLVLPALLFEAAVDLDLEEVRQEGVTLAALAVPGVVAAIAIIVLALAPVDDLFGVSPAFTPSRDAAVLFAALVSATDPVAVVALFRALDAPRRLQVIIEGESLLNDGTAIIFFTLALGASGGISMAAIANFVYIVGAAIIVGGLIGAAAAEAIRRLDDPVLEILFTIIAAYGSFTAGEAVHASGVIATVIAGLLCGSRSGRKGMSAPARIGAAAFWEFAAFALNSLVFLSIGLTVKLPTLLEHWRAILAAYAVVTLARAVVTGAIVAVLPARLALPRRWTAILSWGGLRGALSMVLAVSIPESHPQRDLLVTMTFGVVVLSILIQGVTVSPALRWLGLTGRGRAYRGYDATQSALLSAHSSLEDLERTGAMVATNDSMRRALTADYDEQLDRAERELSALGSSFAASETATLAARRLLATTERERIIEAHRAGAIDDEQRDRRLADLRARWWNDGTDA
jgi:CPA1 family monovalent cation:H+ antiporter